MFSSLYLQTLSCGLTISVMHRNGVVVLLKETMKNRLYVDFGKFLTLYRNPSTIHIFRHYFSNHLFFEE